MMRIVYFCLLVASSALRMDWPHKHRTPHVARDPMSGGTVSGQWYKPAVDPTHADPKSQSSCSKNMFMDMTGPLHSHLKVQKTDYAGFNPAIAKLPPAIAKKLHADAFYVLATKLSHNQCQNFCYANSKVNSPLWMTNAQDYDSAVSILNRDMDVILGPVTVGGGEDMRLLLVNNTILADYHFKGSNWEVRELHLGIMGGQLSAALGPISLGDKKNLALGFEGQNIGLIARNGGLYGIWWLDEAATKDVRKIGSDGQSRAVNFAKESREAKPNEVHNSVHPIWIPELNKYLGAAHFGRAKWGQHGTKYASEYLQYMALFEPEPPFKMVKRSPDFCFPTLDLDNLGKCEVIQYVTGIMRDPQRPEELLISYGINDCESMLARVPLRMVLHSMYPSNSQVVQEMKKFEGGNLQ